jgi:hypothetical protein
MHHVLQKYFSKEHFCDLKKNILKVGYLTEIEEILPYCPYCPNGPKLKIHADIGLKSSLLYLLYKYIFYTKKG